MCRKVKIRHRKIINLCLQKWQALKKWSCHIQEHQSFNLLHDAQMSCKLTWTLLPHPTPPICILYCGFLPAWMVLHTDPFTHRRFYTQKLLHTDTFTHRRFYTMLLHTHTHFHTQTLLHTDAFTYRPFYTQTFYTQKLLHTEAFTHRNFYTQKLLHTNTFTHRSFKNKHFHTQRPDPWNRNFTSVFDVQRPFRAKGLRWAK